jgi:hypothetical protein
MNREPAKYKLPETGVRIYRLTSPLRHLTPGIEVLFVLEGGVRVEAGNDTYRLAEADILLLSRSELVRIIPESFDRAKECLLLVLRLAPGFLSFAFGGVVPAFKCNSTDPANPDCGVLRGILAESACYDMAKSRDENTLLFDSALFRLLHELKRNFPISEGESPMDENEETKRERLLTAYINKNYRYPLSLEELAEKFSLSPRTFPAISERNLGLTSTPM